VILTELNVDQATSRAQAEVVAEKIRQALAATYLLRPKREGEAEAVVEHHCSASIGVVLFIDRQASQDDILKWADKAMYRAKEAGRNAIRFHEDEAQD